MKKETLRKISKWIPNRTDAYNGLFLMIFGLLMLTGGAIGVKGSISSEGHWISLPRVDSWLCWVIIWLGFDTSITGCKITKFIVDKTIKRAIFKLIGEDRLEKWNKRLAKNNKTIRLFNDKRS